MLQICVYLYEPATRTVTQLMRKTMTQRWLSAPGSSSYGAWAYLHLKNHERCLIRSWRCLAIDGVHHLSPRTLKTIQKALFVFGNAFVCVCVCVIMMTLMKIVDFSPTWNHGYTESTWIPYTQGLETTKDILLSWELETPGKTKLNDQQFPFFLTPLTICYSI